MVVSTSHQPSSIDPALHDAHDDNAANRVPEGDNGMTRKSNINVRRLLAIMPLLSVAASVTMAPKIEVYTLLACSIHRPDIYDLNRLSPELPSLYNVPTGASVLHNSIRPPLARLISATGIRRRSQLFDPVTAVGNGTTPDHRTQCASDPVVKTAVAKLTTVIAAFTGFLMCITTGWWGSFSDRNGRKFAMIVSTLSLLITDLNFIVAALFTKHIPGGYWFLLIGPIADGLFGGMTIGMIAIQSYIADTTHEADRSRAFSFALGLLFSGMALGPTFGSLFIHFTGSLISVFYLSAVLHALYAIFVVALVPESLSRQQMDEFRAKYFEETAVTTQEDQSLIVSLLVRLKKLFAFLTPLVVFFPVRAKNGNPLKRGKRDWSLTVVIIGYGFTYCVVGSYSYKFQYANSTFGWNSEELGYFLGIVGGSRAVYLALILPVIIRLFKPKQTIQQPEVDIPLDSTTSEALDENTSTASTPLLPSKPTSKEVHSSAFDLKLAKYALLLDIVAYAGMGLSRTSLPFTIFGALSALGAGFGPATEAVILTLYTSRGDTEKGKLLGAVGVVQAICSQIIGPAMFGLIYMKTVTLHPRTIYAVSVSTVIAALLLLNFVRLPKGNGSSQAAPEEVEEQESSFLRVADQTE
ncbi:MFS general substrate transporter [Pholiota conissans]|uniref:MFS general substrate transporter n=1 Tax=Pholiota conissans TaxID=109636 RepID=A0A9P6CTE5_9AGAR|nr:MFS general substrate transporter [Pholiota conissans]